MYPTPYQFMKAVVLDIPFTFFGLGVLLILLALHRKRLKEKSTYNITSQYILVSLTFICVIQIVSVSASISQDEVLRAEGTITETDKFVFEVGNISKRGIILDSVNTPLYNKTDTNLKEGLKYELIYTSKSNRILEANLKEDK